MPDPLEPVGEFCHWPNPAAPRFRRLADVGVNERRAIVKAVLAGGGYERVGWLHHLSKGSVQHIMLAAGQSMGQTSRAAGARLRWARARADRMAHV